MSRNTDRRSDTSKSNRSLHKSHKKLDISVDTLFPSDMRSGTRGDRFDIDTLFANTPLNSDPDITFTSDVLLERINKRRIEKLKCYKNMLRYCHKRIAETDANNGTDIVFSVVDTVPECREYKPLECLEYISKKLRLDDFDTFILNDVTMFITWSNLELKKEQNKEQYKDRERGDSHSVSRDSKEKNPVKSSDKDGIFIDRPKTKNIIIDKSETSDPIYMKDLTDKIYEDF